MDDPPGRYRPMDGGVVNPMSAAAGGALAAGAAVPEPQHELPGTQPNGGAPRGGKLSALAVPFEPPSPQTQRQLDQRMGAMDGGGGGGALEQGLDGGGGALGDERAALQQQLDSLGLGQQLQLAAALTQLAAGAGAGAGLAPPPPPPPDGGKPAPWADALGELLVGIDRLDRGIGDMSARQEQRVAALEARLLRAVERRRQQQRAFDAQCEAFASTVAQLAAQIAAHQQHQQQQQEAGSPPPAAAAAGGGAAAPPPASSPHGAEGGGAAVLAALGGAGGGDLIGAFAGGLAGGDAGAQPEFNFAPPAAGSPHQQTGMAVVEGFTESLRAAQQSRQGGSDPFGANSPGANSPGGGDAFPTDGGGEPAPAPAPGGGEGHETPSPTRAPAQRPAAPADAPAAAAAGGDGAQWNMFGTTSPLGFLDARPGFDAGAALDGGGSDGGKRAAGVSPEGVAEELPPLAHEDGAAASDRGASGGSAPPAGTAEGARP